MSVQKKEENLHSGHRKKVRNRYYECGLNGMADHNVLEFLLFYGIQRKDTNELAHRLIATFGSLSRVFEAKFEDLIKVKGMTENAACLITMILPLYEKYVENLHTRKPDMTTKGELVDYLRSKFSKQVEQVYVVCFDAKHSFISCRLIGEGDISSSSFDIRKLVSIVLETNASNVVLAHNHPYGIHLPSQQDVKVTEVISNVLANIKVNFADHLIITDSGYSSMVEFPRYSHIFYGLEPLFKD